MFLQALSRYYGSHDTHLHSELSILEEVLPTYFPDQPMHPAIQALSYGETPLGVASDVLEWAGLKPEESFMDLGCGCGAVVLLAASRCRRAAGVDLSPAAIGFAQQAARDLEIYGPELRQGDLLQADLAPFDLLYCCSTAVSQWLAEQLSAKLNECRAGARLITVTHTLRSPRIQSIEQRCFRFSWHRDRNVRTWDYYLHRL